MKKSGLMLLILFVLSACEKEEDPTPSDPRDSFTGAWSCDEDSRENGVSVFEIHINKSSANTSRITVENLYNYGFSFSPYAEINTSGTGFTIPSQVIQGNTVKGSGVLLGTITINMDYIIDNGVDTDTVTAVLTKK